MMDSIVHLWAAFHSELQCDFDRTAAKIQQVFQKSLRFSSEAEIQLSKTSGPVLWLRQVHPINLRKSSATPLISADPTAWVFSTSQGQTACYPVRERRDSERQ